MLSIKQPQHHPHPLEANILSHQYSHANNREKKIVNAYLLYFNTLRESVTIGGKQVQNKIYVAQP